MALRRYFIGIGTQRSGTTWISHYLRQNPEVCFSPLKEVNFFTSKYTANRRGVIRSRLNTKLAVLGIGRYGTRRPWSGLKLGWHYLGMRREHEPSYRRYMAELARHATIAGEISPSYGTLSPQAIARAEALLDQPNYLFIMRNPVDRLLSEYSFRTARKDVKQLPKGDNLEDTLMLMFSESQHLDYAETVSRFAGVVDQDRLHLMFTEDLFDPDQNPRVCAELCAFLGITPTPATMDRAVNRAPSVDIDPELRARLVHRLAAQYNFAATRFGNALPASWQNDLALLNDAA